ncbi:type II toxin-antitoxin system Phd/YefM family antitoxin [Burkholderia cepacia]|uniref:type II toxin-antitoxin system Phd/YefM family antitoxin n=1 Tax=Burkholderia cepacia TaxID=292 RepID=UPI003D677004
MRHTILASVTASVSELKRNPMGTVAAGEGFPVAILNHDEPAFYCVPAKTWEAMVERLEDIEDNALVDSRANGNIVKVKLVDL